MSDVNDSMLAPIVVGYTPPDGAIALGPLAVSLSAVVPPVTVFIKRQQGRKNVSVGHTRKLLCSHGNTAGYPILVRCVDVVPGENAKDSWPRWRWEVGLYTYAGGGAPATGRAAALRLDVTRFRTQSGAVVAGRQLALLRHLLIEALQGWDPDAVVSGGQHVWRHDWWPVAQPVPAV